MPLVKRLSTETSRRSTRFPVTVELLRIVVEFLPTPSGAPIGISFSRRCAGFGRQSCCKRKCTVQEMVGKSQQIPARTSWRHPRPGGMQISAGDHPDEPKVLLAGPRSYAQFHWFLRCLRRHGEKVWGWGDCLRNYRAAEGA
jgi:hypothetical protein